MKEPAARLIEGGGGGPLGGENGKEEEAIRAVAESLGLWKEYKKSEEDQIGKGVSSSKKRGGEFIETATRVVRENVTFGGKKATESGLRGSFQKKGGGQTTSGKKTHRAAAKQ